ncbi:hypothetical protein JOD43_000456 [Pullulanibacillus pueri]|uniref:Uncharacterized protein n=1 Tax=Pullulanibacillus pueri TaxID=1437324 RepID=A0A8J2ZSG7_9BACL|nr:hypothetical protein [Pullulanibacillus pueri]MBM7680297.1 hypothetical protein [Pullulanibacillus pueri]GGH75783.1 hypothetical protein GCM10007096_05350 [Pullulanibacillus pueri]
MTEEKATNAQNKKMTASDIEAMAKGQMNEGGIWSSSNSSETIAERPTDTTEED